MSLTDDERREVRRICEAVSIRAARETILAAAQGVGLPRDEWQPGTVSNPASVGGDVTLRLDRDVNATTTARNRTGGYLSAGARVMVLLNPPHGSFVMSLISPRSGWQILDHVELTADGPISFPNISQAYQHLEVILYLRAASANVNTNAILRVNSDATAVYDAESIIGSGPTPTAVLNIGLTGALIGQFPGNSATAGNVGSGRATIPNYTKATLRRAIDSRGGWAQSGSGFHLTNSNIYRPATLAAVTRLDVFDLTGGSANYKAGSTATLMGMAL